MGSQIALLLGNITLIVFITYTYFQNRKNIQEFSAIRFHIFGIAFLDINNLKVINDQKGHEMGDCLLKAASDIIQNRFGKFGKSYRIGGDEFCVLLENVYNKM